MSETSTTNSGVKEHGREAVTMVIGASLKPWRYAYKAVRALKQNGYPVVAIGLREGFIDDVPVQKDLPEGVKIDTVTLYVGAGRQNPYYDYLMRIGPRRVIFNPGAENDELAGMLSAKGIETLEACTLVMLSTKQY
ncbi:MAG: CoA-binding protein [Bacteroidota bacterium]|mgnify:CR=1 FL=1